mgnify:FL=1
MKKNMLYTLWWAAFAVCAALGFLPEKEGALGIVLKILSLIFFLPPGLLLLQAKRAGDEKTLGILRTVSLTSLGLTLALLIMNILFATGSKALGNVLHGLLTVVSAPMMTMGNWAMSMFLWACLFFAALSKKEK